MIRHDDFLWQGRGLRPPIRTAGKLRYEEWVIEMRLRLFMLIKFELFADIGSKLVIAVGYC